jgi:hypothetical protein
LSAAPPSAESRSASIDASSAIWLNAISALIAIRIDRAGGPIRSLIASSASE